MSPQTLATPWVGGILSGAPWTGGKPSAVQATPHTLMCFWSDDYDTRMKVYKRAVEGLETSKFKGFGDTEYPLKSFRLDVLKHLQECGMEGVFHLEDAKQEIHNYSPCITHSGNVRWQTSTVTNPHNLQNLDWSELFLLNSLESKFQWQLAKYATSTMNGPALWKSMVLESQSNSVAALITLMQELQTMSLKAYSGENVKQCTTDIFNKCSCFDMAGVLPSNLGMMICEILLACSFEDFWVMFMMKRHELTQQPKFGNCLSRVIPYIQCDLPNLGWVRQMAVNATQWRGPHDSHCEGWSTPMSSAKKGLSRNTDKKQRQMLYLW